MFFFFELNILNAINQAFEMICLKKMLADGYIDMSVYILGRLKKEELHARLILNNSKYAALYELDFPVSSEAYRFWNSLFPDENNDDHEINKTEAEAIVNWVYQTMDNCKEREDFTISVFKGIKCLHNVSSVIKHKDGVFYNEEKVTINLFSSITEINSFVINILKNGTQLFFRGHSNANYILLPSIMRTPKFQQNESKMYHTLMINCPLDFENCHSHLEKLVEMQHYGLPTRLLDITRNLLVALFFACEDRGENYGEVVLISSDKNEIKYPQSDTVSILSSLPVLSFEHRQELLDKVHDPNTNNELFNRYAERLIQEIKLEKPTFCAKINKTDIMNSYIVYALKNNNRIIKQDGAFILCGLNNEPNALESFRYEKNGKKVILLVSNKNEIMGQLETFSITRASLFPEIDSVADYIKKQYS